MMIVDRTLYLTGNAEHHGKRWKSPQKTERQNLELRQNRFSPDPNSHVSRPKCRRHSTHNSPLGKVGLICGVSGAGFPVHP
jgi:hypothetical protein